MPNLVILYGPQAVGKMTVGQELAKLTGYKLFHNHMTIEIVRLIFDYDRDIFWDMNGLLRKDILEEYAKSNQKGIIYTCCFDFGPDYEKCKEEYDNFKKLYPNTYVVELEADLEERLRRNKTENRLNNKPSKRDLTWSENDLLNSVNAHRLNSNEGEGEKIFENYVKINNTNISAEDVAKMIQEKFEL